MSEDKQSTECHQDCKSTTPEFIYGGPFIRNEKNDLILEIATPPNAYLQGIFKRSFAYYSLKERLPIILTKVIDQLSREGTKIKKEHNATDDDIVCLIRHITKLKSDLVTNKPFEKLQAGTPEAALWNR